MNARTHNAGQAITAAALLAMLAGAAAAGVEHGRLDVEFSPFTVTLDSSSGLLTTVTPDVGRYDFFLPDGPDPDDNPDAVFPVADGVLLVSASETRDFASFSNESFVASAEPVGGFWRLRTFQVEGIDPGTGNPQDNEINIFDRNLALDHDANFAYFPFEDGFIAASAFPGSTVTNGPLTTINSTTVSLVTESAFATYTGTTPALVDIPEELVAPFVPRDTDAEDTLVGRYPLVLPQFKNVHREGVLIASSPSGESQSIFPVQAQNDNDSYIAPYFDNLPATKTMQLWVYDVNSFIGGIEADAVSFVYLPYGTTYTTPTDGQTPAETEPKLLPMGIVLGSVTFQSSQGPVSIELFRTDGDNNATAWTELELKVEGLTPSNATLISVASGGASQSQDNIHTSRPNAAGDGWILQMRDGPSAAEDAPSPEHHAVHFVVLPDGADINPATPEQVPSILTNFEARTVAGNFTTEALATGNGRGAATDEPGFPPALEILQIGGSPLWELYSDNRGDNVFKIGNMIASPLLGVNIPQATELGRFDIDAGFLDITDGTDTRTYRDFVEYSAVGFENRLITESINDGGELDTNFAMVHFPVNAGFPQQPEVTYIALEADGSPAAESVPVATATDIGFDTNEGVLFARNSGNNQNIVVVDVDATQFEMRVIQPDEQRDFEGSEDPVTGIDTDGSRLGWVAIPYETPGLVAAQVNADGTIANSTGTFTLTQTTIQADIINADLTDSGIDRSYVGYNLVIDGVDSRTDGVLLLQGIGDPTADITAAAYPIYQAADDGSFDIVVIDVADRDTSADDNILDVDADYLAPFMFAYIPYAGIPTINPDLDGNQAVADLDVQEACSRLDNDDYSIDIAPPFGTLDFFDKSEYLKIAD